MKSLFILFFFTIIIWLTYNYSYNKYFTDKIETEIKFVLLPLTIADQFKYQKIDDIFNSKGPNSNYDPELNIIETTNKPNKISLQRYFTQF